MDKQDILNLTKELIEKITIPVTEISIATDEAPSKGNNVWFQVEVEQPHFFLARGGEALFALNHVIRRIVESKMPNDGTSTPLEIVVDINGFQKKRIESIHAVAHMMAERARYFKSSIEVEPMPAYERRIVHEFLSEATDIKTESEGTGPSRRVVIKYIGTI
jgi:spoIIIJ-associated protein